MRTFIAAVLAATALAMAPTAVAQRHGPGAFLQQLRQDGFTGTNENLLSTGQWVCSQETGDHPDGFAIIQQLVVVKNLSNQEAIIFVGDTNSLLC